jgi:hypothetical protein
VCSSDIAWKRLISHMHECISLITAVFSDHDRAGMVGNLSQDDAQNFINMIYEVSATFSTQGDTSTNSTPC